ncbi:TPA: hypothetical protein SAY52_005761 [Burkholderia cenocepacia]|uniref:hypothetical protein n=1 Tax=unclassified Burkholderia TaxID=2613784 RepID=UPI00158B18BE|nr:MULTISPECIES: hypothetical protein [unclassified Burkholderia]HEF5875071.1 hypothetical protein [Burkholderia cenocepacia]
MIDKLLAKLFANLVLTGNLQRDVYLDHFTGPVDLTSHSHYFVANHAPFSLPYDDRRRDGRD